MGVLADLHKDAKTIFKCPLVQIVAKQVKDGKLESLTLCDGKIVSSNVEPLNEEMAAELNQFQMFDLLKIYNCLIKGNKIILTEHKEVLGLHGQVMPLRPPDWALSQSLEATAFSFFGSLGHQVFSRNRGSVQCKEDKRKLGCNDPATGQGGPSGWPIHFQR